MLQPDDELRIKPNGKTEAANVVVLVVIAVVQENTGKGRSCEI